MDDGLDNKSRESTLLKYFSMNLRVGDCRECSFQAPLCVNIDIASVHEDQQVFLGLRNDLNSGFEFVFADFQVDDGFVICSCFSNFCFLGKVSCCGDLVADVCNGRKSWAPALALDDLHNHRKRSTERYSIRRRAITEPEITMLSSCEARS